jgi:hypothetical protein
VIVSSTYIASDGIASRNAPVRAGSSILSAAIASVSAANCAATMRSC